MDIRLNRSRSLLLALRTAGVAIAAVAVTGSASATNIPLGDLNLAQSRVPEFHPFDETVYHDAKNWPEIDATCTSAPCASGRAPMPASWGCSPADPAANGQQDATKIDCAVGKASAQSVVWLPKGVYEMGPFGSSSQTVTMSKSDVVLRCEDPNESKFMIFDKRNGHQCKDEDGVWNANLCGAMAISIASYNMFGTEVPWVSGFASGNTQIGVPDASVFAAGDWVMLQMDDGRETCDLIDSIPSQASHSSLKYQNIFNHYGKVVAVSGNTLTIDRGLRMDYTSTSCGAKTVRKITPVENVGVEGCGFETSTTTPQDTFGKSSAITVASAVNSWLVGNQFTRFDAGVVRFRMSARNWFQGNRIDDVQGRVFNTDGLHVSIGAGDNVIENNAFMTMTVSSQYEAGAEGNINAYNYVRAAGAVPRERSFMSHGRYVREFLWEGNDVDTEFLTADHWWGRQGPRITIFRNRAVGSGKHSTISTNRDKTGSWPIATDLNWIGNNASFFARTALCSSGFPGCLQTAHDIDAQVVSMHVEKNLYRDALGFQMDTPESTTNCGSGVGACPASNPGPTPLLGTNAEGMSAPASWSTDQIPHSLYRSATPPTWWCQEACAWDDVHQGIGAWGDNYSASLCKLPAQIMAEGGTCTPMAGSGWTPPSTPPPSGGSGGSGGSTTPTPPPAPFLLP